MAVPIYVWNGTAWESTGPTIPASPIKYQTSAPTSPSTGDIWVDSDADVTSGSQQFQRFRFVASGGETTISGADANGAVLAYTAGLEQVVLNGAVLVRGHDYTATTGTTITGLSPALVASDVLEVFSFIAFTVANTYTQSQVDGLVTSANAEPGMKLIVPSSAVNGTVGATGTVTFSGASSVSLNGVFSSTYSNYLVLMNMTTSTTMTTQFRFRTASDDTTSNYNIQHLEASVAAVTATRNLNTNIMGLTPTTLNGKLIYSMQILNPNVATETQGFISSSIYMNSITSSFYQNTSDQYTGFTLVASTGTIAGTVRVYGYKN